MLQHGLIDPEDIIIDSKSGVFGAGRTPKTADRRTIPNVTRAFPPITSAGIGTAPEIDLILSKPAGKPGQRAGPIWFQWIVGF